MNKSYKILGKRGRITIPFEIRQRLGFAYNDILSFEEKDGNTVVIRREKLCDDCQSGREAAACPADGVTLLDFLDGLTDSQQRAALIHLSVKWAERRKTQ